MAVLLKVTLFCQLINKKVRRILFADYAVRHRLQAVKERRKLWETLAAVRVHARDAVVDAFVYV